jgi:hypothetical protein
MSAILDGTMRRVAVPVVLCSALLAACGHGHGRDDGLDPLRDALNSPDGDIDTSSETIVESDYDDIAPLVLDADPTSVDVQGWGRRLTLLVAWGHRPNPDADDAVAATDWTGSLTLQGGRARVIAHFGFSAPDAIEPRNDPSKLSFVSHTSQSTAGLLLEVVQDTPEAAVALDTRATGLNIDLASVRPDLSGSQPVGSADMLVFHAVAPGIAGRHGFVVGRFRRLGAGVGRLHARVVDGTGAEVGRLRGIYGHAKTLDLNVFFAKLLDPGGTFQGRVRGTYADHAFAGDWGYDTPLSGGKVVGRFWEGPAGVHGRGALFGHWSDN